MFLVKRQKCVNMKCKECGSEEIDVGIYEICEWWIETYPKTYL